MVLTFLYCTVLLKTERKDTLLTKYTFDVKSSYITTSNWLFSSLCPKQCFIEGRHILEFTFMWMSLFLLPYSYFKLCGPCACVCLLSSAFSSVVAPEEVIYCSFITCLWLWDRRTHTMYALSFLEGGYNKYCIIHWIKEWIGYNLAALKLYVRNRNEAFVQAINFLIFKI